MASKYPANRRYRPPAAEITPETPIWCPNCERELAAARFPRNRTKFSGLNTWCKECVSSKVRTEEGRAYHRARNKERWQDPEYREKALGWQRARRGRLGATYDLAKSRARLQAIIDAWKASGCADCGFADVRALDADHRDPAAKLADLPALVRNCASEQRVREELAKCDVRCARCHRLRTQEQRPPAFRARYFPPSWQAVARKQAAIAGLKLQLGCVDCGWCGWPRGLDFDHLSDKTASISQLIANSRPWQEIIDEMAKCEVRCANCHRIKTIERRRGFDG